MFDRLNLKFVAAILLISLVALSCDRAGDERAALGPATSKLKLSSYHRVYHVSPSRGSDLTGEGSRGQPWRSVNFALAQIRGASSSSRRAILVSEGVSLEDTIQMVEHVDLLGGFSDTDWRRDVFRHRTILSGEGKRRVLAGADHALLDGFVITGGRVRDKGAALLCDQVSPLVRNNVFLDNGTLAPECWSPSQIHETANDGGAIYAENGAAPVIENNLFVRNQTEIGRGAALAFSGQCEGRLARNIFLNNVSGTRDTMRSSDGGAVSIFDRSSPMIEENLFIGNQALANNDGGGLFVALWSAPRVLRNLFVGNKGDDDGGALFVGGQEHRYDQPLDPLPAATEFYVEIDGNILAGNSNPSRNSGAIRFTMEARGRFSNNVTVENTGLYFQRSEVEILNNTILDNFRFVDTKETLGPSLIRNNLIWGATQINAPLRLEGNNLKQQELPGDDNISREPVFVDDSMILRVESAAHEEDVFMTRLTVRENFDGDGLAGRIIEAEGRYSAIAGAAKRELKVWGDFSGSSVVRVLSSLTQEAGGSSGKLQGAGQPCRFACVR